jgi:hypothetical protein
MNRKANFVQKVFGLGRLHLNTPHSVPRPSNLSSVSVKFCGFLSQIALCKPERSPALTKREKGFPFQHFPVASSVPNLLLDHRLDSTNTLNPIQVTTNHSLSAF